MMEQYRIVVAVAPVADESDESTAAFIARAPELPGCEAHGETRAAALAALEEELEAQLLNMREQGIEPPVPVSRAHHDGKLSLTISPRLHEELAFMAREADVDLNTLLTEMLTRAVARPGRRRDGGGDPRGTGSASGRSRGGRPGARQGGTGERYHNIMENRADFIEYVRGLENGGEGSRGRGGRGRR